MRKPAAGDIRVLVADDNDDVAGILEALVNSEEGLVCVGRVGDGTRIVEEARRQSADVLLLDIELNGVSGIEVLRECRKTLPSLSVVILTGHSHPGLQREARSAGAADFLIKPDDLGALAERIRNVV